MPLQGAVLPLVRELVQSYLMIYTVMVLNLLCWLAQPTLLEHTTVVILKMPELCVYLLQVITPQYPMISVMKFVIFIVLNTLQTVQQVPSGWQMVTMQLKVELKSATTTTGALFVMMDGELLMPVWLVDRQDSSLKVWTGFMNSTLRWRFLAMHDLHLQELQTKSVRSSHG